MVVSPAKMEPSAIQGQFNAKRATILWVTLVLLEMTALRSATTADLAPSPIRTRSVAFFVQ